MTVFDYRPYFPYKTIRPQQEQAIEFILDAFLNQGKKFVLCQMSTGVGKSVIGVTVARYLTAQSEPTYMENEEGERERTTGAYVLTTQKILQDQYMRDFGPAPGLDIMRSLKSASNYVCKFYCDQSCAASRRLLTQLKKQLKEQIFNTDFYKCCHGTCCYVQDKVDFMQHPLGITNFSYFLAETMYAKQLTTRSLLVVDECHNVEEQLGKHIEVTFSERFAKTVLSCKPPKSEKTEDVIEWVAGAYKKALQKHISSVGKKLQASFDSGGKLNELSKKFEMLDKHICKVNRFIEKYDPSNWVMNVVMPPFGDKGGGHKFEFKPVDVSSYGNECLFKFGSRVLMMSATIIDKSAFCKSNGIPEEQAAFLNIPSPFPIENRLIHFLPVGSMSMKNIDRSLPKMVEMVGQLLELHKEEKGIIHTVSFKTAKYLIDTLKDPRLMLHDDKNRELTIKAHVLSADPTVLVSPSMTEGVDLVDDASRFQIIVKVPYPYLGDKVVVARKAKNPDWYAAQTVKTVIQALGRSIRNETDHAVSYILDSDWEYFFKRNRHMFPSDFIASLVQG